MAPTILFIVLSLLFTLTSTHIQSNEEGFISVQISNKGLDFAKDVLIDKAVSSIVPLQLPDIEKSVNQLLAKFIFFFQILQFTMLMLLPRIFIPERQVLS
jgi:hypothetical protein